MLLVRDLLLISGFGLLTIAVWIRRAATARRGQALARNEHPRTDHLAHVDQIAHRIVDFIRRAEIANRGIRVWSSESKLDFLREPMDALV